MQTNKRILSILLAVFLALGATACANTATPPTQSATPPAQSAAAPEAGTEQKLTIVHTNDVHSYVDIEPYVKSLVGGLRAAGENVILVSAGDAFAGTPFARLSDGQNVVDVMNDVGYELVVLGNHEQDMQRSALQAVVRAVEFPVLALNLTEALRSDLPEVQDYIIKEYAGTKVAFLGVTWAAYKAEGEELGDVTVRLLEEAKQATQAEGASVFVAVTHVGVTDPDETNRSTYIADKCPWLAAIIDGHCHTAHEGGVVQNGVLIAETGEYGANIGVVELTLKDGAVTGSSARLIPIKDNEAQCGITPDEALSEVIAQIRAVNDEFLATVVAQIPFDLDGERETTRTGETNFGDLICDALLWKTGADFSIASAPFIRMSVPAGDLTNELLLSMFYPSPCVVYTRDITGAEIVEMLEGAVKSYPDMTPSFKQVGGIRFVFDPLQEPGSRVVSVTLRDGTPVLPDSVYTFAHHDAQENWRADAVEGVDFVTGFGTTPEVFVEYLSSGEALQADTDGRILAQEGAAQAA